MTPEELVGRYLQGERDFRGIKLTQSPLDIEGNEIDLRGLYLQEINLSGACLKKADFTEADLTGANLFGSVLEQACLKRAIVRDANLYSANLRWCNLTEADLRGSVLDHINATCAYFDRAINIGALEYAILADASFRDAHIPDQLICRGGNLIWRTIMPDGTIKLGPQYGDGEGR
ncbi:pentapeptide repeat-containing protein [Nostoc sp.]|uniref:pentapeptide repeat-containing protein n=1 Tax=Nostoc sp. TaxID=1180 RepID=UPI002FF8E816